MHRLRIGLLLCDDVDEAYRDQYGTYSEMFQSSIDESAEFIELVPVYCHLDETLPAPEDFDGYIISGSRYSVYEPRPWILDLQEFVGRCWQQNVKIVGICFGHQLIAHALGGKTEKAGAGWGFGIHAATVTEPQSWMKGLNDLTANVYNLIVIHQDQVMEIPPAFTTIAENDFCPHSMIVAHGKMLGIQGHPEFNKAFCKFRATLRRERIGEEVYQSALHSLRTQNTHSETILGWVKAFLRQ